MGRKQRREREKNLEVGKAEGKKGKRKGSNGERR